MEVAPSLEETRADPRGSGLGRHIGVLVLTTGLLILSLAYVAWPGLRLNIDWPAGRQPIGAFGAAMSLLTSALAYVWYSFRPTRRTLLVAAAFMVFGLNQLIFGLAVPAVTPYSVVAAYFSLGNRLIVGLLLTIGGVSFLREREPPAHPLRKFLVLGIGGGAALALIQTSFWFARDELPRLCCGPGNAYGPTAFGAVMCAASVLLFLTAAVLFLHRPGSAGAPHGDWLSAALILAAFSQLQYFMLSPPLRVAQIATTDLLRIAQYLVLFGGLMWEVRQLMRSERERTAELSRLHDARDEAERIVAHDLIHSIATVKAFTGGLAKRWGATSEDEHRDAVRGIERQVARLAVLAEDTLTALTAGPRLPAMPMQPEAVSELVGSVVDSMGTLHRQLELHEDEDSSSALVDGNLLALCRVLLYLIWNTEESSTAGTTIAMAVAVTAREVSFAVSGRGPDGSDGDPRGVFARETGTEVPIRGFGLSWSRSIVEAHGGTLSMMRRDGTGPAFLMGLPRWSPSSV